MISDQASPVLETPELVRLVTDLLDRSQHGEAAQLMATAVPEAIHADASGEDAAHIARMDAEMTVGFRTLNGIGKAVAIFGSATADLDGPDAYLARTTAARAAWRA